jgi:hypothetical protein
VIRALIFSLTALVLAALLDGTRPARLLVDAICAADRAGYVPAALVLAAAVMVLMRGARTPGRAVVR